MGLFLRWVLMVGFTGLGVWWAVILAYVVFALSPAPRDAGDDGDGGTTKRRERKPRPKQPAN